MLKVILTSVALSALFFYQPNTDRLDQLPEQTPGTIEFIGDAGSPNVMTFENWGFTKVENADTPENIQIEALFDIRTLKCDWEDLQKSLLKKKDYFFARRFPEASLIINGATVQEDGSYTTQAELTLKGITQIIELNFTVSNEEPYTVHAEGVIQRRLFNFYGDGPKDEVPVVVDAVLSTGEE